MKHLDKKGAWPVVKRPVATNVVVWRIAFIAVWSLVILVNVMR